ncbi:acetoin utilization protein AcuC [Candidatus Thorarchaeota archaeon]|nr:MAG: acetoin utilization protein AcuC [Candidatus Thorarchaeota archaeon]
MAELTALYSLEKLLALEGIDDLERMRAEVNPFWNRARLDVAWNLPVMSKMTENKRISVQPMREATREELLSFHDPSFVETLELFGNTGSAFSARFGLDTPECPIFQDVHKYASLPVGGVVDATMGVAKGKFKNAISYIGGFHHAMESNASGFCYLNDTVIAIKKYKERYPGKKVLYLDTDVHHGDGTQMAFYDDPDVLTISMHELSMGFYPGTGRPEEIGIGEGKGYSVNIPLPPLTDDVEFWKAFEDVVVPIWLIYKPDFVLWDIGADAHIGDPLADLMLTYDTYHRLSMTIRQLVHLGSRKLVAVGGGGYDPVTAAKVWTIVLADLADIALPPILPTEWIELSQKYGLQMRRGGWTDRPRRMEDEHYPNVSRAVDESIKKVKELIFPILGLE